MKILIVKLGAIGDIVHTLPAFAALRAALPDVEVGWVAEKRSAEILRGNPLIDDLIEIDTKGLRTGRSIDESLRTAGRQVRELRSAGYDTAVDFQGLLKSGFISKLSGAATRLGFSKAGLREPAASVFYTDTVDVPAMTNVIRKNIALASAAANVDLSQAPIRFPIETTDAHKAEAREHANPAAGGKFALLNPAGGWVTKLWDAAKYGKLADRLWEEFGLFSLVAAGPNEMHLAKRSVAASASGKIAMVQPTLKGFYELAKLASVYVGGDTGPTHLAVAAGSPVVGIFGPTEWWRNGSLADGDICVGREDIGCRIDCHRRKCSQWICMDIDVETVFNAVRDRLAKVREPAETFSR